MKSLRHIFLYCIIFFTNTPFADEIDNSYQKQSLLAVLFKRTSAEYKANTFQIYTSAKNNIDKALADKSWTALKNQLKDYQNLPPAIILDIDETVLDNSEHQVRSIKNGTNYPIGWKEWVSEESAGALPGVKEFLSYANTKGIKIFYVTNRTHDLEEYTRNNIKSLGLPFDNDMDVLLMKNEKGWGSDKTSRRDLIRKDFRVIQIFGDQLDDFIPLTESAKSMNERKILIDKYADMWGEKWYMLINPMYGEWEEALYEHCWSCYPEENDRVNQRLKALE
jgi:5'-nucleotidase (lipoprotein e(P4) family)|tara:strand:- start:25907 stop:26743 length:837 start_codon:yes stop_codon:yes gene_type:complete